MFWLGLLSDNEALCKFSLKRNLQRFALASLFFCTNGEDWETKTHWLNEDNDDDSNSPQKDSRRSPNHHIDECQWFPSAENDQVCNENYEYTLIKLSQNGLHDSIPKGTIFKRAEDA